MRYIHRVNRCITVYYLRYIVAVYCENIISNIGLKNDEDGSRKGKTCAHDSQRAWRSTVEETFSTLFVGEIRGFFIFLCFNWSELRIVSDDQNCFLSVELYRTLS